MLLLLLPKKESFQRILHRCYNLNSTDLTFCNFFFLTQLWQTIELKPRKVFYLNTSRRGINPCLGAKSIYLFEVKLEVLRSSFWLYGVDRCSFLLRGSLSKSVLDLSLIFSLNTYQAHLYENITPIKHLDKCNF